MPDCSGQAGRDDRIHPKPGDCRATEPQQSADERLPQQRSSAVTTSLNDLLQEAVESGQLPSVEDAIRSGANPYSRSGRAIFAAIATGFWSGAEYLIEQARSANYNVGALLAYCFVVNVERWGGDLATAEFLIKNGADLSGHIDFAKTPETTSLGERAFWSALSNRHQRIAALLLAHGESGVEEPGRLVFSNITELESAVLELLNSPDEVLWNRGVDTSTDWSMIQTESVTAVSILLSICHRDSQREQLEAQDSAAFGLSAADFMELLDIDPQDHETREMLEQIDLQQQRIENTAELDLSLEEFLEILGCNELDPAFREVLTRIESDIPWGELLIHTARTFSPVLCYLGADLHEESTIQLIRELVVAPLRNQLYELGTLFRTASPNSSAATYSERGIRQNLAQLVEKTTQGKLLDFTDCIVRLAREVRLPCLMADGEDKADVLRMLSEDACRRVRRQCIEWAALHLVADRSLSDLFKLNHFLHQPISSLPIGTRPYQERLEWPALFEGELPLSNNYSIVALTSANALVVEGESLEHCVGNGTYAFLCACGYIQILSLRHQGNPVATITLQRTRPPWFGANLFTSDESTGWREAVFKGHGNNLPDESMRRALDEWIALASSGDIPFVSHSQHRSRFSADFLGHLSPFERSSGLPPDEPALIERIRQHYEMLNKRFSESNTKACNRLIVDFSRILLEGIR